MKIKEKLIYERNMKEHYQEERDLFRDHYVKYKDLTASAISELTFKNLMVEHLLSIIDEVIEICDDELACAVLENGINRHELDKLIHAKLLFSNDKEWTKKST